MAESRPVDHLSGAAVLPAMEERLAAHDGMTRYRLASWLRAGLAELGCPSRGFVVLCVGTDRSTGDSLGPLVGYLLLEAGMSEAPYGACPPRGGAMPAMVSGTLDRPVHAANLQEALAGLYSLIPDPVILAIDACLGHADNVGTLTAGRGPLRPGAGVNKQLPPVGHLYITGTVNVGGFMEYFVLQNTRLSVVMHLARQIAAGIALAVDGRAAAPRAAESGE